MLEGISTLERRRQSDAEYGGQGGSRLDPWQLPENLNVQGLRTDGGVPAMTMGE